VRAYTPTASALYASTSAASGSPAIAGGSPSEACRAPNLTPTEPGVEDGKTKKPRRKFREKNGDGRQGRFGLGPVRPNGGENSVYRVGFDGSVASYSAKRAWY